MKKLLCLMMAVLFVLSMSGCSEAVDPSAEPEDGLSPPETTPDDMPPTDSPENPSLEPEPSPGETNGKLPYLGEEDVALLFAERNTISDWIKDIKENDIVYNFYVNEATCYTMLEINTIHDTVYDIASFVVETTPLADFRDDENDGKYSALPDEVLALEVTRVFKVNFEAMGIPYSIRGISKGSSVDNLKEAFLDMQRGGNEMYNIRDVIPDVRIDEAYTDMVFIGGNDCTFEMDPDRNNGCNRRISYTYSLPYGDDEIPLYTIYGYCSIIDFSIDENGTVAGFGYRNVTHLN